MKGNLSKPQILLTMALGLCLQNAFASALTAHLLQAEHQISPLGLGTIRPQLSWTLHSNQRNQSQTAYQVLAASTPGQLAPDQADLWDSGKVVSADPFNVAYAGRTLSSGQRVFWKVRVWDSHGEVSPYSRAATFELALLRSEDWKAQWIAAPSKGQLSEREMFEDQPRPLLRKEFAVGKRVARARAYVSGLGYYELRLNGKKVGDHVLDPGWTDYSQRVLYSTFDVTKQLRPGQNAIGFMLGNGWFNPLPLRMWGKINPRDALTIGEPRAILQLVIEFTDGSAQTVVTDGSWRAGEGPILRNSVYLGETYDARREQPGWDVPGFDDSPWPNAVVARKPKLGPLEAQSAPPIRITRMLRPVKLSEPKPGVHVFDFGQNFAGWAQLRVKGPVGTRVRLRYGELLYPDGTLNGMTAVCGQIKGGGPGYVYDGHGPPKTAFQLDEYTLKGDGTETYTPRFSFHGFRYVEVTGFPGKPTLDSLTGLRLNSDVRAAGSFECSNELFNRIQQMVLWSELSNLFSVQSDCPHREKFGYGGDIVASSEMAILNFDMGQFYAKAVQDLADAVRPNGGFTETAPFVGISDEGLGEKSGPIGWGTAQPLLLFQLRQYYGEQRLLTQQFDLTKRWIELLDSKARDGILENGISDHESLAPKPRALTGTAFYHFNLKLYAQLARTLGRELEAREAEIKADHVRAAFNRRFLQPATGRYDSASQACQAFALYHGLIPPEERARALEVLVRDITEHGGHLTTGIFGTKYLLEALTEAGRAEVAYDLVNQKSFPGWGYMLERGATTLWEHWEYSDDVYSHNHPMFGSVSEWFYKALAGIKPAPEAVGFDKILIKPQPVGDLKWVKASYHAIRGKVSSAWRKAGDEFKLQLSIPVGTTATVSIPAKDGGSISEGGRPLAKVTDVKLLRMEGDTAILAVGSGDYQFVSRVVWQ